MEHYFFRMHDHEGYSSCHQLSLWEDYNWGPGDCSWTSILDYARDLQLTRGFCANYGFDVRGHEYDTWTSECVYGKANDPNGALTWTTWFRRQPNCGGNADGAWTAPHSGSNGRVLCQDGTFVSDWKCLAGGHGQRAQCPPDQPYMCAEPCSSEDLCCDGGDSPCGDHGGARACQAPTEAPSDAFWIVGDAGRSCTEACLGASIGLQCDFTGTTMTGREASDLRVNGSSIGCTRHRLDSVSAWWPGQHMYHKQCFFANSATCDAHHESVRRFCPCRFPARG